MEQIGKIHENAMFLRNNVGTAETEEGVELQLGTVTGTNSPIVYCSETGKYFTIEWQEIVKLALENGITNNQKASKQTDES